MNMEFTDFIAERLLQLKVLLEMMRDEEWNMSDKDRARVISTMSYFADPMLK